MKSGDLLFVLPKSSIRFGGRWGTVVEVNDQNLLPITIKFAGEQVPYMFGPDEVITQQDYFSILSIVDQVRVVYSGTRGAMDVIGGKYPYIQTKDGSYPLHQLVPVQWCGDCGKDITGQFSAYCEDCQYPIPQGV